LKVVGGRNRRQHPATALEESCPHRGHHFLSLNDPYRKSPFAPANDGWLCLDPEL
jgi:hypothetical protein